MKLIDAEQVRELFDNWVRRVVASGRYPSPSMRAEFRQSLHNLARTAPGTPRAVQQFKDKLRSRFEHYKSVVGIRGISEVERTSASETAAELCRMIRDFDWMSQLEDKP